MEALEGQFFKCSTVFARPLHVDLEERVLPVAAQSSIVSLEALRDSLGLQRGWLSP